MTQNTLQVKVQKNTSVVDWPPPSQNLDIIEAVRDNVDGKWNKMQSTRSTLNVLLEPWSVIVPWSS